MKKKIIKASKPRSTDKKFTQGGKSKQYILTLKMTTAQVVETLVTVNNCSLQGLVVGRPISAQPVNLGLKLSLISFSCVQKHFSFRASIHQLVNKKN